jgi:hypothetical protein
MSLPFKLDAPDDKITLPAFSDVDDPERSIISPDSVVDSPLYISILPEYDAVPDATVTLPVFAISFIAVFKMIDPETSFPDPV